MHIFSRLNFLHLLEELPRLITMFVVEGKVGAEILTNGMDKLKDDTKNNFTKVKTKGIGLEAYDIRSGDVDRKTSERLLIYIST